MKELLKTIDSIAFQKMDERLLAYLQNKAEKLHSKILHTTHQEIAYDLNASREAVSRLLKQLENDRYVSLGRNKIEILTKWEEKIMRFYTHSFLAIFFSLYSLPIFSACQFKSQNLNYFPLIQSFIVNPTAPASPYFTSFKDIYLKWPSL